MVRTTVTVVAVLASVGLVTAVSIWLSWRSPAALSEEDTPRRPRITDGIGRPAGPDAEAMGVLDRGVIVTGPPPPGGVPTDAPRPRPAPRRSRRVRDRRPSRPARHRLGPVARAGPRDMDVSEPAPSDVVVGLRGLERRYRELFEALGEDESSDDLAQRRAADGWSVIDHVVAATEAIAAADRALGTVLTADDPTVRLADVVPTPRSRPATATGPVDERLGELGRVAAAAADRIAGVPAGDWSRAAVVEDGSGRTVTALDIARAELEAGVAHLRAAREVLTEVTARPAEPS
jgi:hypothetical protein